MGCEKGLALFMEVLRLDSGPPSPRAEEETEAQRQAVDVEGCEQVPAEMGLKPASVLPPSSRMLHGPGHKPWRHGAPVASRTITHYLSACLSS